MNTAIYTPRPRLLTADQLERIHEAAVNILDRVGMRVMSAEAMAAARQAGLRVREERVLFDPSLVEEFTQARGMVAEQDDPPDHTEITLAPCQYATHMVDPETDQVVPFTTARLVEAAKLADTLVPLGVIKG